MLFGTSNREECSADYTAHRLKSVPRMAWVTLARRREVFARWESAESEAGVTAWACNEKGQDAVELVLAFEGARVVCLPTSDVHWLFNPEYSVEFSSGFVGTNPEMKTRREELHCINSHVFLPHCWRHRLLWGL